MGCTPSADGEFCRWVTTPVAGHNLQLVFVQGRGQLFLYFFDMLFDRMQCMKGLCASLFAAAGSETPADKKINLASPLHEQVAAFHKPPPPGVSYQDNPTPFGKILRGELPAAIYNESDNLLAFRDQKPRAPLHALVITKKLIPNVLDLSSSDVELLIEMRNMAEEVIKNTYENAYEKGDYILCFHVAPFNSVDHLHLHVLAPKTEMNFLMKHGKYALGMPWCAGLDDVIHRLQQGRSPA